MVLSLVKRRSAWIPIAMSAVALTVVLVQVAFFGAGRQPDEGTAAHLWQLFIATQLPVIAFFAIKWLPKVPKQATGVLVLQGAGLLAAAAPVLLLGL